MKKDLKKKLLLQALIAFAVLLFLYLPPTFTSVLFVSEPYLASTFIESSQPSPNTGSIALLSVTVLERAATFNAIPRIDANPLMLGIGLLHPRAQVFARSNFVLPGESNEEYDASNEQINLDSSLIPAMVVFDYLDLEYTINQSVNVTFLYGDDFIRILPHGGSSGDVGLALEIYSRITGMDITSGKNIAGVGTLTRDGSILPVGGFALKQKSARANDISTVYAANAQEDILNEKDVIQFDSFSKLINSLE